MEILSHFRATFELDKSTIDEEILDCLPCQIDETMNRQLEKSATMEKMRRVVYQLGWSRALEPNGFPRLFY